MEIVLFLTKIGIEVTVCYEEDESGLRLFAVLKSDPDVFLELRNMNYTEMEDALASWIKSLIEGE